MDDSGDKVREIRINPIVPTESVLVATARGMRPKKAEEQVERDLRARVESCPFCRGNEDRTPPEIKAFPPGRNGTSASSPISTRCSVTSVVNPTLRSACNR